MYLLAIFQVKFLLAAPPYILQQDQQKWVLFVLLKDKNDQFYPIQVYILRHGCPKFGKPLKVWINLCQGKSGKVKEFCWESSKQYFVNFIYY